MIANTLGSENVIAQRLEQLAELYRQEQASELMERTLSKLFQYEADVSQQQLRRLNDDLSGFEQQYGMSSPEFYELYQSGKTDDSMDYVEWASLFQMAQRLKTHLALLCGEKTCASLTKNDSLCGY
ncbi:MAG: hypothetical protein GY801_45340 [bacterium]|nr:hypothetical protein [bacterium]